MNKDCLDCPNSIEGICCHAAMRNRTNLVGSDESISAGVKHIELLNRIAERKARIAENERKARNKLAQEQAWADELERIAELKAAALFALLILIPILVAMWSLVSLGVRG